MLPIIFCSGPVPTCLSTSMRTVSRSRPIFCRTLTATPCPNLIRPSKRCSVPTKLWLKRSASLRASASTCCARGVKLLMASSLILLFHNAIFDRFVHSLTSRPRRTCNRAAYLLQPLAHHVHTQHAPVLGGD